MHIHLKWDSHINKIASQILNIIGIMYRLKHMAACEIILTIYNRLIKPHILCRLKCWDFQPEKKLQKKAMRIICSSVHLSHNEPLIHDMYRLQLLTFCFDNNLPAYFITMFSLLQPPTYQHKMYLFKIACVFVFRIFEINEEA